MIYVRPFPEFVNVGIEPYEKSIWETICTLFEKQYYFAGCVMTICSMVLPIIKTIGLLLILSVPMGWIQSQSTWPADLTRLIATFSAYQFVDIFMGLLFVAFCNTPEVHSTLLMGYYFFLAYCIISYLLVFVLLEEDNLLTAKMWKVEKWTVQTNLVVLLFLFCLGFGEPMLDVSYPFHGITFARSRMGLLGMMYQLSSYVHITLGVIFIFVIVISPLILGILYLMIHDYLNVMQQRQAMTLAMWFNRFALTDVFCLALITFLFSVQGLHVRSSVPNGTFFGLFYTEWLSGFYVALGYGAAVFTLKWRALSEQTDQKTVEQYYGLSSFGTEDACYEREATAPDLRAYGDGPLIEKSNGFDGKIKYANRETGIVEDSSSDPDNPKLEDPAGAPDGPGETSNSDISKLMKSPVFHIKITSWIIWAICYFGIRSPPTLTFLSVNTAVGHMLPLVNEAIRDTLPPSFGNCSDVAVPKPCVGEEPLYESEGSTRVTVRWATGLNTIFLDDMNVSIIPDSAHPIQMTIQGKLEDMQASILIENCLIGCHTIWDNAHGCCRKHRKFNLVVASNCIDQESNFSGASLGNFTVEWLSVESLMLEESFLGVSLSITDVTPSVEAAIREFLSDYLEGNKVIALKGSSPFTFSDAVRRVWEYNLNERRLQCKELLKQI